jgi:transposase InsO family protein
MQALHEKFGHANNVAITKTLKKNSVTGISACENRLSEASTFCKGCVMGKHKSGKHPSETPRQRAIHPADTIHMDLIVPMRTRSLGGSYYALTATDDYSTYKSVRFLKTKEADDTVAAWRRIHAEFCEKSNRYVRCIRTDNGSEFCNKQWEEFNCNRHMRYETSAPFNPQQNGLAERANRTMIESARSMLHARNLPTTLWCEAVNTASYVRNRVVTKIHNWRTPFELLTGHKPDVSHLVVFGTNAYAPHHDETRPKFASKTDK